MSMKKCPKCGELYADSYGKCPYCTEEEELYGGTARKGNFRAAGGGSRVPVVALIVVAVLALGALAWYLISGRTAPGKADPPVNTLAEEQQEPPEDDRQEQEEQQEQEPPEELTIAEETLAMKVGDVMVLGISTGGECTWTSSDAAVAEVNADGEVRAVGAGTAVITATDAQGQTASCTVTVEAAETTQIAAGGTNTGRNTGTNTGTTGENEEEEENEEEDLPVIPYYHIPAGNVIRPVATPTNLN